MLRNMTRFRDLARNHDFTALWVGQTISELGSRMSAFVFPILALQLSGSTLVASIAEATYLVGVAAALLPAGVLADRMHRGRLMRVASGSGALLYGSLVVAGILGHLTIPHLMVVGLLTGIGSGLFSPAEMSAIKDVVSTDELPTALSQNQARQHLASLLGGPVGGALYGVTRWFPFVADTISYAVSFLLLGRLRTDLSPDPAAQTSDARRDLVAGMHYIAGHRFLRVVLVWSAWVNLTINAIFFVTLVRLVWAGFTPGQIGLAEAAASGCGILGAILAPAIIERCATGHLTVVIAWSWLPLLVPLALWNHPAVMAAALGSGLLLNPAGNAGIGAYRVATTPDELQGRVNSTMQFTSWSTMPLAPVVGGVLLTMLGGTGAILALGGLTAISSLFLTMSRSVRRVPRPARWAAQPDSPRRTSRISDENATRSSWTIPEDGSGEGGREGGRPGLAELGERDLELVRDV
jgi:MFS family permease